MLWEQVKLNMKNFVTIRTGLFQEVMNGLQSLELFKEKLNVRDALKGFMFRKAIE